MQQLFKIIELTGNKSLRAKVSHVTFGLVLGMSTRRGTVKFLDDILRDVGDHMHEVMRKNEAKYQEVEDPEGIADILGISSVMVQDMTGKRFVCFFRTEDAADCCKDQQLSLQHGRHDLVRRLYRAVSPIRARKTLLHLPQSGHSNLGAGKCQPQSTDRTPRYRSHSSRIPISGYFDERPQDS